MLIYLRCCEKFAEQMSQEWGIVLEEMRQAGDSKLTEK